MDFKKLSLDDPDDSLRKKVMSAIGLWHKNTCIRFEPYSKEKVNLFCLENSKLN